MKTVFPTVAFALLSSSAFGQQLFASATYQSNDFENGGHTFIQRTADAVSGPLSFADSQTLTFGGSTFQGQTRTTSDYGQIGLYARADLDDGQDAPSYTVASAGGAFIDPLTISGGSAGGTIHAEIRLRGIPDSEFLTYYGYYTNVEFYFLDNGNYVSAGNQTFERHDNGVFGEGIDLTVGVTLTDYDPRLTYYLSGAANVSAEVDAYNLPGHPPIHATVDAEHTAEITKVGFVGPNGLSGRFLGGSRHLYPVPEPATLVALGAGLALLRRRKAR